MMKVGGHVTIKAHVVLVPTGLPLVVVRMVVRSGRLGNIESVLPLVRMKADAPIFKSVEVCQDHHNHLLIELVVL